MPRLTSVMEITVKISGGDDIKFLFPTALAQTLGIGPNYFYNFIDDNKSSFQSCNSERM